MKQQISLHDYRANVEKNKEALESLSKELSKTANIFFSSEEGRKFGRQLLKSVHYFEALPDSISDEKMRYIQAQRDLINVFMVGLISNETLVKIIKD